MYAAHVSGEEPRGDLTFRFPGEGRDVRLHGRIQIEF